jgi:hypothetical protein
VRGAREVQANEAGHFDALRWPAAWTKTASGRSRTAAMSRGAWSRR